MDPDEIAARQKVKATEENVPPTNTQQEGDDVTHAPVQGGDAGGDADVGNDAAGAAAAAAGSAVAEGTEPRGMTDETPNDRSSSVIAPSTGACAAAESSEGNHDAVATSASASEGAEGPQDTLEAQQESDNTNSDSAGSSYVTIDLESGQPSESTEANPGAGEEPTLNVSDPKAENKDEDPVPAAQKEADDDFFVSDSDSYNESGPEIEFVDVKYPRLKIPCGPMRVIIGKKFNSPSDSDSSEEANNPVNGIPGDGPVAKAPKISTTASNVAADRGDVKRPEEGSETKEAVAHSAANLDANASPVSEDVNARRGRLNRASGTYSLEDEDPVPNPAQASADDQATEEAAPVEEAECEGAVGGVAGDEQLPQGAAAPPERVQQAAAAAGGRAPGPAAATRGRGPAYAPNIRRQCGATPSGIRGRGRGAATCHCGRIPILGYPCRFHTTFPDRHVFLPAYGPSHQPPPERVQRAGTYSSPGDFLVHVHAMDRPFAEIRLHGANASGMNDLRETLSFQVRGETSGSSSAPMTVREDISVHVRNNNGQISVHESRMGNDRPGLVTHGFTQGLGRGMAQENARGPTTGIFTATPPGNFAGLAPGNFAGLAMPDIGGGVQRNVGGVRSGNAQGTTQGMFRATDQGAFNTFASRNSGEIPRNAAATAANVGGMSARDDRGAAQGPNAKASGNFNARAPGSGVGAVPRNARGVASGIDELPAGNARRTPQQAPTLTPGNLCGDAARTVHIPKLETFWETLGNRYSFNILGGGCAAQGGLNAAAPENVSGGPTGKAHGPAQGNLGGTPGNIAPPSTPGARRRAQETLNTSFSSNAPGGTPQNARGLLQETLRVSLRDRIPHIVPGPGLAAPRGFNVAAPSSVNADAPETARATVQENVRADRGSTSTSSQSTRARGAPEAEAAAHVPEPAPENASGPAPGIPRRYPGYGMYVAGRGIVRNYSRYRFPSASALLCTCTDPPSFPGPQDVAEALVNAATEGDVQALTRLLGSGLNPNAMRLRDNVSALHVAAERGHMGAVCVLLGFGATADTPGPRGRTPLHLAAMNGHFPVVQRLLDSGVLVYPVDDLGETPMQLAGDADHWEVVCALLRRAPLPFPEARWVVNLGIRALHAGGRMDVLSRLLIGGLSPNAVGANLESLLAVAARLQRWDEVRYLLGCRADPLRCRVPRESALAHAATHGRADVVRALLRRGAANDPAQALWALGFATTADVVQAFVDMEPDVVRGTAGQNALVIAAHNGNLATVKALLDAGVNINAIGILERTALQGAAVYGHTAVLNELLRRGADVNAKSKLGDTALHLAVHEGQEECVRILMEAGANPTLRNNLGMLPSAYAYTITLRQLLQDEE